MREEEKEALDDAIGQIYLGGPSSKPADDPSDSFVGTESGVGEWLHRKYDPVPPVVPPLKDKARTVPNENSASRIVLAGSKDERGDEPPVIPEAFSAAIAELKKKLEDKINVLSQEIDERIDLRNRTTILLQRIVEISQTINSSRLIDVLSTDFETLRVIMQASADMDQKELDKEFSASLEKSNNLKSDEQ